MKEGQNHYCKRISNNLVINFDVRMSSKFGKFKNKDKAIAHDAGYDAYMTGFAFALIAKYLEIGQLIAKVES